MGVMERFTLEKSSERPLWWVLTDSFNGIVCRFKEGEFNDTQDYTFLEGVKIDIAGIARASNEMAEWLRETHYELVFTSPTAIKESARAAIGDQLSTARNKKGWTVRYLAQLTGIAANHISRIEQGKYNVTVDTLAMIANALGMKISISE